MLIYVKKDGDIFNLDNLIRIYPHNKCVKYVLPTGNYGVLIECKSEEQAKNVVSYIYHRMTLSNGNVVLDLDDFEECENDK